MSKVVIKAEHISKQYRLGLVGTGTVRDDMKRWWYNLRGKEDPFLKIGEANDRSSKGESDYVWSLRDINFEINQGDSVGIIGRNGAGKSTLLKILSQVTQPTTGKIYTKGRIASLLEVGTGFHPEMTGRENIYLNGAILGMRKHEITRKFDEIVAFSGVERYIDTPVKRYSSGMYVRLAFAVAAHLESEILIVDEVLAVGDAEFQKKCLGKMNDVSKGEGRTVLFVSHSMASVKKLCNKGIVLHHGETVFNGNVESAINYYENNLIATDRNLSIEYSDSPSLPMQIKSVNLLNSKLNKLFTTEDELVFEFEFLTRENVEGAYITIDLKDSNDELVYWSGDYTSDRFKNKVIGHSKLLCKLPKGLLTSGIYNVSFAVYSPVKGVVQNEFSKIISFEIEESQHSYLSQFNINYPGRIGIPSQWIHIE
ncbi:ABC transporter ATP-binding protein [Flavobacterium proteolyticum]|uniref:ATP-binding cassette domain-containing protein n=1 Tax=Flavobacterium proteolyticum TaxID=2911683 RepID=A0ABR9WRE9_9FLAO|nr:polysaccharide ABC transporter ATP-binding protein [Flavobacterium proteolyticum]MBE9576442.1 ATP-binding cassette domain-containing protein [Flavobacterium proteolyticum]